MVVVYKPMPIYANTMMPTSAPNLPPPTFQTYYKNKNT